MLRKAMSVAIIAAALISGSAIADTLLIESMEQSAAENSPQRGLDKSTVNDNFGAPVSRHDSVGEPPISSWEYPDYVVYFENDLVLHTVAKR